MTIEERRERNCAAARAYKERHKDNPEYRARRAAQQREYEQRRPDAVKATRAKSYQANKAQRDADSKAYREAHGRCENPQTLRCRQLLQKYGITVEDYDRMLEEQGGRCAVCGRTEPGGRSKLFFPVHDHRTGSVRGLLCQPCNSGLGLFGDNVDVLVSAIAYLLQHQPADESTPLSVTEE